MPLVSIVTPCYNQGIYIQETIDSVLAQEYKDFEYIIVNDGSTDDYTNSTLSSIDHPQIEVIHTQNQGLASARNTGIKHAKGEIILPLDSDDTIGPYYVKEAVDAFGCDKEIGLVYCQAELFGEKQGLWILPEYSLDKILFNNMIFHCAFFYKKDWVQAGGYKSNMIYGWEDWDFWLSIIESGRKVYKIPGVHHYYRVRNNSMVRSMDYEHEVQMYSQIIKNHSKLFIDNSYIFSQKIRELNIPIRDKLRNRLIAKVKRLSSYFFR